MATKIITRNAAGSVPVVSTGADLNKGSTLTADEHDQNLINLRSAVDTALAGTQASLSNAAPLMDGSASAGSALTTARGDHRHPSDTLKEDKQAINTIRVNLGSPTVSELALIQGQNNNKFEFNQPTLIEDAPTSGGAWVTSVDKIPTSPSMRNMMVGRGVVGGFIIARNYSTRLTWDNASGVGYVYINYLYMYMVTAINTVRITVEYHDGTSWIQLVDQGGIGCWPGHLSIPHTNLPFYTTYKVRITITPTWSTDTLSPYYSMGISVYAIEWWGGYPQGKRDLFSTDYLKGANFPANLYAPTITTPTITVGSVLSTTGTQTMRIATPVGAAGSVVDALHLDCYTDTSYDKGVSLSFGRKDATFGEYTSRIVHYGYVNTTRATKLQLQTHSITTGVWNTGLLIDDIGNVGIGTTTTTNQLTILDAGQSTNAQLKLQNTGSSTSFGYIGNWSNGLYLGNGGYYKSGPGYIYDTASSYLSIIGVFGTQTDSYINLCTASTPNTPPPSRLYIDKNGLVGIGTTVPFANLSVGTQTSAPSATPINLSLGGTYSSVPGANLKLKLWDNGSPTINYGIGISDSQMDFVTGGASKQAWWTNGLQMMTLLSTGNLGIGVTNPAYKLEVNGSFAATTKSFVIDHPTKPDMKLRYGSLEGPENGVYIRGRIKNSYLIQLPDYWRGLVDESTITVNLTPIGRKQNLYVISILNNGVLISGEKVEDINCFYTVYGERKDVEKLKVEF